MRCKSKKQGREGRNRGGVGEKAKGEGALAGLEERGRGNRWRMRRLTLLLSLLSIRFRVNGGSCQTRSHAGILRIRTGFSTLSSLSLSFLGPTLPRAPRPREGWHSDPARFAKTAHLVYHFRSPATTDSRISVFLANRSLFPVIYRAAAEIPRVFHSPPTREHNIFIGKGRCWCAWGRELAKDCEVFLLWSLILIKNCRCCCYCLI